MTYAEVNQSDRLAEYPGRDSFKNRSFTNRREIKFFKPAEVPAFLPVVTATRDSPPPPFFARE